MPRPANALTRLPGGGYRYAAPEGLHDDTVTAAYVGYQAVRRCSTLPPEMLSDGNILGDGMPRDILKERW